MKQARINLNLNAKNPRKQVLLEQREQVVPWGAMIDHIAPFTLKARLSGNPFTAEYDVH